MFNAETKNGTPVVRFPFRRFSYHHKAILPNPKRKDCPYELPDSGGNLPFF